jgi:predicted nicotinamide N-methyase
METLPEINQSYKSIFDMCSWPAREKVLAGAIKLGIFNVLNEPVTAKEVAGVLGTHPGNTGLLLDSLTAIDLVEKKDGRYQNAPVSRAFLVESSPTCMISVFDYMLTYETFTVDELLELVKKGPDSPGNTHTASDEMTEEEVASHAAFEKGGKAQLIAKIVASLPEFKSCRKMLDLGCGPGLNGIAIVSAHPTMKGVLFDRPRTVEAAGEMIRCYGMEDRMEAIGGNYAEEPVGEAYDMILASDTLYYTSEEIDPIMTKLHDALNPGGVMVTIHPCLTSERTKPGSLVMGSLFSALKGNDMGLLDQGFLADAMLKAGFRSVRSKTVKTDWGAEDIDIGRKA